MLRVALYGGAGSGKSTAAKIFSALGVPVIDADTVAKDLTTPGSPQLTQIVDTFGSKIIRDNQLDRALLRSMIFSDEAARMQLNEIMHPAIYQELKARIECLEAPYCVILMPLLVEVQMEDLFDRIVVIDCPTSVQIERIRKRDGLSADEAIKIINAQATRERRLEVSNRVIDNSLGTRDLEGQIRALHKEWTLM